MTPSFHLSFSVPVKTSVKHFYTTILDCKIGRDEDTWFDVLFFGHQLTIHQASDQQKAIKIDHFGPILSKPEWQNVIDRCRQHHIEFLLIPTLKNEGKSDESGKFLIQDPAGNVLEFKFYASFEKTVETAE